MLKWLEDISFIKEKSIKPDELAPLLKSGYLIAKLINRLEGKNEVIKGTDYDPKNVTLLKKNWNLILDFLRRKEKFNSILLYRLDYFLSGDEAV
jgi:hypothetical protein